ncbi:MAG: hypothetical protein A2Z20_05495 [Bdellovibrionales bacterium RBG_16_40_8]|nr:MAG: hypothetical protein A2Z20_05495 [Bdellovibrionales bacterium RBG_16_40_8]
MAEIIAHCFSCQTAMSFVDMISRRDECSKCGADVRVCKNCRFYDPKVYNECREPSAEVVREKERSNLCDFFQPGRDLQDKNPRENLFAAAEALFKKKDS